MKKNSTLFLLLITVSVFKINTTKAQVNVQDSLALVDLYNSTNGANWYNNTNWLTSVPVSTWFGVYVSGNRVTYLNLSFNNLNGKISPSLKNLSSLVKLTLEVNNLIGTIPSDLGKLTNLQVLYLHNNRLTGEIPDSLSKLAKLYDLNLSSNQLNGKIPSSFGNLTNLIYLYLEKNKLTGSIPNSLNDINSLRYLILDHNQFRGSIPSLNKLSKFQYLDLSYNNLTGKILSKFDSLKNLYYLGLNHNQLIGIIPNVLGNLINLEHIDLDSNEFTGAIPTSLTKLKYLGYLHLENNQFTFAGMENIATTFPFTVYSPQANINIQQNGNVLKVVAGGTLANNTYNWYKNGVLFKTKTGNASLTVNGKGNYSVSVTNSVATELTLHSDTVNYAGLINSNASQLNSENNFSSISVYPNPAKTTATILFKADGKYTITITDISGKILQIKNGFATKEINSIQLDVSNYASGSYFVVIKDESNHQQTIKLNKE